MKRISYLLVLSLLIGCGGGGEAGFTTSSPGAAPVVTTLPATSVGANTADLNGNGTPNGLATVAWLEYGTDPSLASPINTSMQALGSGTTSQPVNAPLTGLTTGVAYYFRVAASNSTGTTKGGILSFVPGGGGSDVSPPYVVTQSPASGARSVPVASRVVSFHVIDAWSGVDPAYGWVVIGGDNVDCSSGTVSCTGTPTDRTFTYTKTTNWDNNATISVSAGGWRDVVGNAMPTIGWTFQTAFPSPPTTPRTKAEVLEYLTALPSRSDHKVLSGQYCQWWNAYGRYDNVFFDCHNEEGDVIENIAAVSVGRYPAILGFQSTMNEFYGNPPYLGRAIAHWDNGGLVEILWRPDNPTANTYYVDSNPKIADISVVYTPGTSIYDNFRIQMDFVAAGLHALTDNGVKAILFRPFFEVNTGSTWSQGREAAKFIALWRYTYDYFVTTKGLTNLIWVFSSCCGSGGTEYYPGSSYVDIVGYSYYSSAGTFPVIQAITDLQTLGKPFAMTEISQCSSSAGRWDACTTRDSRNIINDIRSNFPNTIYWMNWSWRWASYKHNYVSELFNDPWVVNRSGNPSGALGATHNVSISNTSLPPSAP